MDDVLDRIFPSLPAGRERAARAGPRWHIPVVALTAILCYANSLNNEFTYDDIMVIKKNKAITGERPTWKIWVSDYWSVAAGVELSFRPEHDLLYRPLTLLTYQLNYLLDGHHPRGYHVVNILLHAWVSVIVVQLARKFGFPPWSGWIAGMIFAVMPIHVEAVSNVVGRAELLASLFTLLAMQLTYRQIAAGPRAALGYAILVAVMNACAVLSKEVGAAAYPIAFLCLVLLSQGARRRIGILIFVLFNGLLGSVCLVLRWMALGGRLAQSQVPSEIINQIHDAAPFQHFWTTWKLLGMHLSKTVYPDVLCFDYAYRAVSLANGLWEPLVLLGFGFGLLMIVALIYGWRRDARLLLIVVGWGVSYFPVSNSLVLMKTFYAERVWYSPSVFFVLALAWGLGQSLSGGRKLPASDTPALPHEQAHPLFARLTTGLFILLVLIAMMRCWIRTAEWRDNLTLFAAGYRDLPQSTRVCALYGAELAIQGQLDEGAKLIQQALEIHPGYGAARHWLGRIYMRQENYRAALEQFSTTAMQYPDDPAVIADRDAAAAKLLESDSDDLLAAERAYRENPTDLDRLRHWLELLVKFGRGEEAVAALEEAEAQFPASAPFQHLVAVTSMLVGLRDETVAGYQRSLELDPTQGEVAAELAMFLLDRRRPGDLDAAEHWVDHAFKVSPNHVAVRVAQAEMLAVRGKMQEAAAAYRTLINGVPNDDPRRAQWQHRIDVLLGPG